MKMNKNQIHRVGKGNFPPPPIAYAAGFLPPFSMRLLFLCPGAFLFSLILSERFFFTGLGVSRSRVL